MRNTVDASAERLEQVTAQLEQAAKQHRGSGPLRALRPFVLGALAGAGMALLYAPQRGEQTRAMLRRNATDLQDRATQTASSVKERLPEQAQTAPDQAQGWARAAVEPGKETLQAVKAEAEQGANEVTTAAKKRAPNGARAEEAQTQPQRDRKTGSENPA
jgi:gas vesicle protein